MSHYKTYALYTCHLFFVSVIYSQLISSNNNWTNRFNWEEGFIKSFILFYLVIKYTLITYNIHTTYFNDIWIIGNKVKEKICSPQSWLKECNIVHCENTAISPNFLVWKFCGKAQFQHSFGRSNQKYAEIVPFHKISTPENYVKSRYFSQCYTRKVVPLTPLN